MNNDFIPMTEEKALMDFKIDIYEYVNAIEEIDDIISFVSGSLLYKDIGPYYRKQNWKKVIEKMNLWYSNLMMALKKPDILSADEKKPLKEMEDYLENNSGKLTGAYPFRFKVYKHKIQEYKDVVLSNKMTILALKDEIDERVKQYRDLLNEQIEKVEKSYLVKRDSDKKKWGQTFYTCECGMEVQKVNKSHHNKQKNHLKWVLENQQEEENVVICQTANSWHTQKYRCSCGKDISKGNKTKHEETKYHKLYKKDIVADDNIDKKKQTTDNIVLTIQDFGDKLVANAGNKTSSSYDDALDDFRYF
jgi:hypothetical protein